MAEKRIYKDLNFEDSNSIIDLEEDDSNDVNCNHRKSGVLTDERSLFRKQRYRS